MNKAISQPNAIKPPKVDRIKTPVIGLSADPHRTAANILGMLYISRKRSVTNPEGIGGKSNKIDECQSGTQQTTAEAVAKDTGVSPRTIKRDAAYAEAAS